MRMGRTRKDMGDSNSGRNASTIPGIPSSKPRQIHDTAAGRLYLQLLPPDEFRSSRERLDIICAYRFLTHMMTITLTTFTHFHDFWGIPSVHHLSF
jgi:hypothetical protein